MPRTTRRQECQIPTDHDKLVATTIAPILDSSESHAHPSRLIHAFFCMSTDDIYRFKNEEFRTMYFDSFHKTFSMMGNSYSPDVVDEFTTRFTQKSVDDQLKTMRSKQLLIQTLDEI